MAEGMDAGFVRAAYQKLSDEAFAARITREAAGLTPAALDIVRSEIERRQLSPDLLNAVAAQRREYDVVELDRYCALIRALPCPATGLRNMPLNASLVAETMSFFVLTLRKQKILIASPTALDKANQTALIKTSLLGWWAIPWGPIRSVQAIRVNIKSKKDNHAEGPNDLLRSFVLANIGVIESHKNDPGKLYQMVSELWLK